MGSSIDQTNAVAATTLVDLLTRQAGRGRGKALRLVSARFTETTLDWRQVLEVLQVEAARLRGLGVSAGERIGLSLTTELEAIASFLALIWLGAIPVSVGVPLPGQSHESWLERLARLAERGSFDRILLDGKSRRLVGQEGPLGRFRVLAHAPVDPRARAPRHAPAPATPKDAEPAFHQFSSGSTFEPRGVVLLHGNVIANLEQICRHDGRTPDCEVVMWVPLSHDMGLVGGLLSPLVHGNGVTLMHPACFFLRPRSWLEQLSQQRAQVSACPNFALDAVTQRVRDRHLEGLDLSSMRFVWNGGEPVRPESIRRFERRLAPLGWPEGAVQPAYGLAEATLAVTARPAGSPLHLLESEAGTAPSVGRPLPGTELRITDQDGTELPPGRVGEIQVRGPSVSPRARKQDGWLRSGDLGVLDEHGELAVTGRAKDLILVRGRNFFGHDVAERLDGLEGLERGQHHAFSIDGDDGSVVVVVTVRCRRADGPGAAVEDDDVRRYLLRELGLPVDEVHFVRRLPRTSSGKVRRGECERLVRARRD